MSLMAYPSNAVDAFQSVGNMTDDIWYHSNDTSTDVSIYQAECCFFAKKNRLFLEFLAG